MKQQPNKFIVNITLIIRNIALLVFVYLFLMNTQITINYNGDKGLKWLAGKIESAVKAVKFIRSF